RIRPQDFHRPSPAGPRAEDAFGRRRDGSERGLLTRRPWHRLRADIDAEGYWPGKLRRRLTRDAEGYALRLAQRRFELAIRASNLRNLVARLLDQPTCVRAELARPLDGFRRALEQVGRRRLRRD